MSASNPKISVRGRSLSGSSLSEGVEDHSSNAALALQALERSVELLGSVLTVEAVSAVELVETGAGVTLGGLLVADAYAKAKGVVGSKGDDSKSNDSKD